MLYEPSWKGRQRLDPKLGWVAPVNHPPPPALNIIILKEHLQVANLSLKVAKAGLNLSSGSLTVQLHDAGTLPAAIPRRSSARIRVHVTVPRQDLPQLHFHQLGAGRASNAARIHRSGDPRARVYAPFSSMPPPPPRAPPSPLLTHSFRDEVFVPGGAVAF